MRCALVTVLGFLLAACSGPSAQERIAAATGCYRLTIGSWSDPEPYWAGFTPATFLLDTSLARGPIPGMRVLPDNPRIKTFVSGWTLLPGDSLFISWSGGLGGVSLRLLHQGDTLRGVAHGFTDLPPADGSRPSATALALRVPCPSSPLEWAGAQ